MVSRRVLKAILIPFILAISTGCSLLPSTGNAAHPITPIVITSAASTMEVSKIGSATPESGEISTPTALVSPTKIDLSNNRGELLLHPGDRFLIDLGEGYDWTIQVENISIVDRVKGITVVRGAQGVYEAISSGATRLLASGDPTCRNAKPACMLPSILFEITIKVQ